jgi:predicted AAA+ superfamily ATPase
VIALEKFSRSQKEQIANPRKFYPIDNGLLIKKTERGKLLESCVVQHIRRLTPNAFYWKDARGREVDIYLPEKRLAIQVAYELNNDNVQREERALESAVESLGAKPLIVCLYPNVTSKFPTTRVPEFLERIESMLSAPA